jgi:hypothetical protein
MVVGAFTPWFWTTAILGRRWILGVQVGPLGETAVVLGAGLIALGLVLSFDNAPICSLIVVGVGLAVASVAAIALVVVDALSGLVPTSVANHADLDAAWGLWIMLAAGIAAAVSGSWFALHVDPAHH